MAAEKFKVVFEKVIDHCYQSCPYFGVDGGPSPVMCCDHPQLAKEGIRGYDTCIISHPVCDTGFPEKCPLRRLPEAKVDMLERNDIDDVQECVSTHPNGGVYVAAYNSIKTALTEAHPQADNNIIGTALEQLTSESERLRDYLQNNIEGSGIDIPDEVWVPFTAALAFAEKASTAPKTRSRKAVKSSKKRTAIRRA